MGDMIEKNFIAGRKLAIDVGLEMMSLSMIPKSCDMRSIAFE